MGGKDLKYQMILADETLQYFNPGQIVFFERARRYGGGWWMGITHVDGYEFIFNHPIKFSQGLEWMNPPKPSPIPPPEEFKLE